MPLPAQKNRRSVSGIVGVVGASDMLPSLSFAGSVACTVAAHLATISVLTSRMSSLIHPRPFPVNQIVFIAVRETSSPVRADLQSTGAPSSKAFLEHHSTFRPFFARRLGCTRRTASARWDRQCPDPPEHRSEQASGQMALCQQEPVVPRTLHQPMSRIVPAVSETWWRQPIHCQRLTVTNS